MTTNTESPTAPEPSPADRFKSAMKQILSVPKAEIDRRETAYQKQRAELKKGHDAPRP